MKELIAYFSRCGENYVSGMLRNLDEGNTEKVAHMIQKFINADLFEIQPKKAYSNDYNICIEEARIDQESNARPELIAFPSNIDDYSTIYLGYPNYWGTMPMAVFTFLDHFNLEGKSIRPFCTHEGSGLGTSQQDIRKCCPNADIIEGLAIHGSYVDDAETMVKDWCEK